MQLGYKFYYLASSQLGGVKPEALDELKRIALTLSQELHGFEQHNKAPYLRHGLEMPPPLPTMDFPTVATPPPQYKQTPDREPKERAFVIADLSDVNQTKKRVYIVDKRFVLFVEEKNFASQTYTRMCQMWRYKNS